MAIESFFDDAIPRDRNPWYHQTGDRLARVNLGYVVRTTRTALAVLKPLGLTKYRLAKDIGVPAQRIGEIVAGKRSITADTDLRLCRYFGLSDGWWLRGQAAYDTAMAREALQAELATIQRCSLLAA